MRQRTFPHVPKSTKSLQVGDFWAIPLDDGRFACGRVLAFKFGAGNQDLRCFLAGLLDWVSITPPIFDKIAGAHTLIERDVHIRSILVTGGVVLDNRSLEFDGIEPALNLSCAGGAHCYVQRGYETVRLATEYDRKALPVLKSAGFMVLCNYANSKFNQSTQPGHSYKPPVQS